MNSDISGTFQIFKNEPSDIMFQYIFLPIETAKELPEINWKERQKSNI